MLWFLHLCSEAGIVVLSYIDKAEGIMTETADGSGRFSEVILMPEIANSVNFDVLHKARCTYI